MIIGMRQTPLSQLSPLLPNNPFRIEHQLIFLTSICPTWCWPTNGWDRIVSCHRLIGATGCDNVSAAWAPFMLAEPVFRRQQLISQCQSPLCVRLPVSLLLLWRRLPRRPR